MAQTKPQYIGTWLATYAKTNTKRVFQAGVRHFLESVYVCSIGNGELEDYAAKYIEECKAGRDWFKDLLKFAADLHGRPPKSAGAFMTGVKSWLEYTLDVEVSRKQARLLRGRLPKGSKARTEESELTREVLRRILTHTDVKGKALFLFLASTGVRIGEALKLRLGDVDLNVDPPTVTVRGEYTKAGDKYQSFLSSEAKEALVEWLKVRESYIRSALNRGRGLGRSKSLEDDRLFPFSPRVAEQMWQNALVKARMAEKDAFTNRHKLHIHMLRKFFLSQAKIAAPENLVESWAGHSGYLDDAYRRYSMDQHREHYRKAEAYLLISVPKDIAEIRDKFQVDVDQLKSQVADLTCKLTDANAMTLKFMNENTELKAKLETLAREVEQLKKMVQELAG
ncbi:MAG: tyrosine-type recombinase/integrase [Candidatus Bathyarchaeia archaeon]